MKTLTVTNNHYWCRGITLEISPEGELTWKIDAEIYRYGRGIITLDPFYTVYEYINLICHIFEFTGTSPYHWNIESTSEKQRIIDLIYKTPLPRQMTLLNLNYCRCDIGPDKLGHGQLDIITPKTYGDLFREFGEVSVKPQEDDPEYNDYVKFYEYPDHVWIEIKEVKKLPEFLHASSRSNGEKLPCTFELDPEKIYLEFTYRR